MDSPTDTRAWQRVGGVLFGVGWGANHFASLLLVYRVRLRLDAAAPALLFGMYALGLVPGLLLGGPLSDRRGRRGVTLPAAFVALMASAMLATAGDHYGLLLFGRFMYGLGAGGAMSAGAVWLLELSRAAVPGGARRATIALSAGFGSGPLVTGVLAQYGPAPTVIPYAVHVAVLSVALLVARRAPDTRQLEPSEQTHGPLLRIELDPAAWRRFVRSVAPMAPFVFAFPAIAFAALPSMLGAALGRAPLVYTGVLCAVTLATGVLVQPATRRFEPEMAARLGLFVGAGGLAAGAFAVATRIPAALLFVAAILGTAYGACMTAGLEATQRLARPESRGGITGLYYVLTYGGFAAPFVLAVATRAVLPEITLGVTATLALLVAAVIR
jgi:Major Facilitator Superfamily